MARAVVCQTEKFPFIAKHFDATATRPSLYETLGAETPEANYYFEEATRLNEAKGRSMFTDPTPTEARVIARQMVEKFGADFAVLTRTALCFKKKE